MINMTMEGPLIGRVAGISALVCALFLLTGAARRDSSTQIIPIQSHDVTLHTDPDTTMGRYYTLSYALPDSLASAELDLAMLEVFVDVSARVRDGLASEAPVLEVYALSQAHTGSFNLDTLDPVGRAVRPVATGAGRRVVLDVTGIVRRHLDGTASNNGLILGSLTGMRDGEFIFASGRFPEGVVGQLRVYGRNE